MEVLILSKTHFGSNVCVGGIVLSDKKYVRLLNPGGWYQYADTEFEIGQVWNIEFNPSASIVKPHIEDVIINKKVYLHTIKNLSQYILSLNVPIWKGPIENIFDNKLLWSNSGAGFLSSESNSHPGNSIGFWISDKSLSYANEHYYYPSESLISKRKLKYKGLPPAISQIPANTLLRVSLAKWWKPEDQNIEERCYAQLSGWYD